MNSHLLQQLLCPKMIFRQRLQNICYLHLKLQSKVREKDLASIVIEAMKATEEEKELWSKFVCLGLVTKIGYQNNGVLKTLFLCHSFLTLLKMATAVSHLLKNKEYPDSSSALTYLELAGAVVSEV